MKQPSTPVAQWLSRQVGRVVSGTLAMAALLLMVAAVLLVLAVDTAPRITNSQPPAAADAASDAARVQSLVASLDPRQQPPGAVQKFALSNADLNLLAREGGQRLLRASTAVRLGPDQAEVAASVRVPRWPASLPLSLWLNAQATVQASASGPPQLAAARIGSLPLPPALLKWAALRLADEHGVSDALRTGLGEVQSLSIEPAGAVLALRWSPELKQSLRALVVPPPLHLPMRAYAQAMLPWVAGVPGDQALAMGQVLPRVFALAQWRTQERVGLGLDMSAGSRASEQEIAAQENRAALITLALYATQQPLARWVPQAARWPQPPPRVMTLRGREDHAQHWLVSAVIAAEGGGRLADAIGVLKEVADRGSGGSGFSFDDLAADRAGTRHGQMARAQPLEFQARMRALRVESDVMPAIDGLPSFLNEQAFREQVGGEGSQRYQAIRQLIEQRVAALPSLR